MTRPDASATELKVPIRTYLHPDTGSRVTFVATHHLARRAYFTQIEKIIVDLQDAGAHVYYEHVDDPAPEQLAAAPKALRKAIALGGAQLDLLRAEAADVGLFIQADTLPWRERHWEVHDVTTLEMAEAFGYTPKAVRKQTRQLKLVRFANNRLPAAERDLQRMRQHAMNIAVVTGGVGLALVLDPRSQGFAQFRERLVLQALDDQRTLTPGADFVLVWGAGHLIGIGQGLVERGYKEDGETWLTAIDIAEIPSLATTL